MRATVPAGSSPLARGLRPRNGRSIHFPRIIPARAGFTAGAIVQNVSSQDHPRSRGVYHYLEDQWILKAGSSPLARGLPGALDSAEGHQGIIPARAGFTSGERPPYTPRPDHPRSRGVYSMRWPSHYAQGGSSPLARGLRGTRPRRARDRGIIPARAGFTGLCFVRTFVRRDHPRSRGVYPASHGPRLCAAGSSPLARGLLCFGLCFVRTFGIIPARAGFTIKGDVPTNYF